MEGWKTCFAESHAAAVKLATSVSAQLNSQEIKVRDLNRQLAVLIKLKQESLIEPYVFARWSGPRH
jgi:hypothetical protein